MIENGKNCKIIDFKYVLNRLIKHPRLKIEILAQQFDYSRIKFSRTLREKLNIKQNWQAFRAYKTDDELRNIFNNFLKDIESV